MFEENSKLLHTQKIHFFVRRRNLKYTIKKYNKADNWKYVQCEERNPKEKTSEYLFVTTLPQI